MHTISKNETLVVEIQEDRSHFSIGRDLLIQDTGGVNVCLRFLCMRGISGSEKPQKDAEVHFSDHVYVNISVLRTKALPAKYDS